MESRKVASFIRKAAKDLAAADDNTTYMLHLDNDFTVYVGWLRGYDENDEYVIHSKLDPRYAICAKVAEPGEYEYEWANMPWDIETKEVFDTCCSVPKTGSCYELAKYLMEEYRIMRKLLKEGVLTYGR